MRVRTIVGLVAAGAGLVSALLVPVGWNVAAYAARESIVVRVDTDAIQCGNPADAVQVESPLGQSGVLVRVPGFRLDPGLSCTFSFIVHNTGSADISIDSIVLPQMGPEATSGIEAVMLDYNGLKTSIDGDSGGALFDLATRTDVNSGSPVLMPGDAARFTVFVEFARPCVTDGSSMTMFDAPVVGVTTYGINGSVVHAGETWAVVGTVDSGC